MRYGDSWAGGLIAVVGLVAVHAAWPFELWSDFGPGPGFFPAALGAGLAAMGSVVGVGGWLRARREAGADADLRKPLLVAAIMGGYLALLNFLGFALATVAFLFTLIHWVESRKAWFALALAVLITLALHLLFDTLLKNPLPPGILRWIS